MLRVLGCLAVLPISFFAALWLIDRYDDQHSPLLGMMVTFGIMAEQQPEVCATTKSLIQFTGQICKVDGGLISVLWTSMANTTNNQPSCGPGKLVRWPRKEDDPEYNLRFFGACGKRPYYFEKMPAQFDPKVLRAAPSN